MQNVGIKFEETFLKHSIKLEKLLKSYLCTSLVGSLREHAMSHLMTFANQKNILHFLLENLHITLNHFPILYIKFFFKKSGQARIVIQL